MKKAIMTYTSKEVEEVLSSPEFKNTYKKYLESKGTIQAVSKMFGLKLRARPTMLKITLAKGGTKRREQLDRAMDFDSGLKAIHEVNVLIRSVRSKKFGIPEVVLPLIKVDNKKLFPELKELTTHLENLHQQLQESIPEATFTEVVEKYLEETLYEKQFQIKHIYGYQAAINGASYVYNYLKKKYSEDKPLITFLIKYYCKAVGIGDSMVSYYLKDATKYNKFSNVINVLNELVSKKVGNNIVKFNEFDLDAQKKVVKRWVDANLQTVPDEITEEQRLGYITVSNPKTKSNSVARFINYKA